MTQVQYGDAIYENMTYAQMAAIGSYLGTDGIEPEDTPLTIAADMTENGWRVPGIDYQHDTDPLQDLADVIEECYGNLFEDSESRNE